MKGMWERLALKLRGKVHVAAVNCDANGALCREFDVGEYPTIKFFGRSKDDWPEDYKKLSDGEETLLEYATTQWEVQTPAPPVRQLTSQAVFEEHCVGRTADEEGIAAKDLCFVAFLPHILDSKAEGRKKYLEAVAALADKFKLLPYSYFWAEGLQQKALEESVGVGGYGYPALVAIDPKSSKYGTLRSAYAARQVKEFASRLKQGLEKAVPMEGDKIPELVVVPTWDGQDAAVEAEEEFSLEDLDKEEL